MDLSIKLKEQGWYLTEDGIKKVIASAAPGSETDVRKIIATAMEMDFREIAGGALPTKREDGIQGKIVLQVQKIRNISAPKANEESKAAPRFLQLDLTDGHTTMQALELEPIAALSLNVPPGTKIYFRADRLQLMSGFIILKASDVQCLGGRVEALVEKWELARTMQKYARAGRRMSGASGPPPWIAFGKKMETTLPNDRNFKSLQAGAEKDKESKENEEFNTMRSEAIAEAYKAGAKKVFGGGGQQIIDHNVKKILEKGYSEEDAKQALRTTNNNLERALYNLKRRQEYKRNEHDIRTTQTSAIIPTKPGRAVLTERDTRSGGKRVAASAKDEAVATKPAGNVSLFDFLTDKLPVNDTATTTTTSNAATNNNSNSYSNASNKFDKSKSDFGKGNYNSASVAPQESSSRPKFENNISSSFAANRTTGPPHRGARGGGGGGERSERDSYNANERYSNSSRYGNARGGGSGGGRGGSNSGSYQSTSGRGSHEESGSTKYSNDRNARSNSNYNQSASGDGGRSNRGSHERSAGPQETSGTTGGYNSRRGGGNDRGGAGERYGNYNENKNRYNQRDNNAKNYDGNRQQSNSNTNNNNSNSNTAKSTNNNTSTNTNNNDHVARMNKLVESTSKIKIDKNREQSGARHHSQQQQQPQQKQQQQYSPPQMQTTSQPQQQPTVIAHQHQQQQQHYAPPPNSQQQQQQQQQYMQAQQNNFTQLSNGFTYDPSKIIGFQNKETNEFAMTLLKSQGMTAVAPQQQQVAPSHAYVPASSPMQPPSPYGTPTTFVVPNPQAAVAAPPHTHFGMIPGDAWMWKIGDLCLAKYWDDGRYYEAEITAVSDKTCVVFFLGYGNHEEVLKTDCLPITDANHRPINNYNQQATSQQQQQAAAAAAMQSNVFQRGVGGPGNSGGSGGSGGSTRYRGERQMYVPPHKRDN